MDQLWLAVSLFGLLSGAVLFGPHSKGLVPGAHQLISTSLMLAVMILLTFLCMRAGVGAISWARDSASLPLRRMLFGLGGALIVLPAAELARHVGDYGKLRM